MTVLGVPMPQDLKDRIKQAADIERRTMADWARLELELAAQDVISMHAEKVAEPQGNALSRSIHALGAPAVVRYQQARSRSK